jgi:hypothetical protein
MLKSRNWKTNIRMKFFFKAKAAANCFDDVEKILPDEADIKALKFRPGDTMEIVNLQHFRKVMAVRSLLPKTKTVLF